ILTKWTKGFSASGVASQDVGVLLSESLKRKGVSNIELVAVVNDTTGALVSCAHQYPDCQVSLILGTGSNCSYMESLDNVELWTADQDGEPKQVIIDTEWGAFGDDGTIDEYRTNLDKELDNHTPNKGRQRFEKMISGLYLGEVVRLILKQLAEHKLIFDGVLSKELQTRSRFETRFISQIEEEAEEKYEICKQVLQELGIIEPTIEDCRIIKMVCQVVSTRAAWMAAAGLGAVVDKLGMKNTTVGMDGSLYLKHPTIHDIMRVAINELSPSTCVKFVHAEDGSGRGAALVAAVSDRLNKKCFNSI
ncbi:hexokinase type 2-like, partial [Saccoglossus kowalevskii]